MSSLKENEDKIESLMSCPPDCSAIKTCTLKSECAMEAGEGPTEEPQNALTRDACIGPVEPSGVALGIVDAKPEGDEGCENVSSATGGAVQQDHHGTPKPCEDAKLQVSEASEHKSGGNVGTMLVEGTLPATPLAMHSMPKSGLGGEKEFRNGNTETTEIKLQSNGRRSKKSILLDEKEGDLSGTEEEQLAFFKELENFFKERDMDFRPPKFYGEELNCLKLWRAVLKLGGYDGVTSCKKWRQVGDCFNPPRSCTTVSWTFRMFYEKTLLEFERHKQRAGVLNLQAVPCTEPMDVDNQASGSGKARRGTATHAMQGSHSPPHLGSGEVSDPKDTGKSLPRREKQVKGLLKRKKPARLEDAASPSYPSRLEDAARPSYPSRLEDAARPGHLKPSRFLLDLEVVDIGTPAEWVKITVQQTVVDIGTPAEWVKITVQQPLSPVYHSLRLDLEVVDIGTPAEWVKITVQQTKDCFEVYALVPGLLREEVRVQSDPAGRLVISGEPQNPDNPWGVRPFKKVVSLPSKINPHLTSAVVTLHGQLFIRAPFNQSN